MPPLEHGQLNALLSALKRGEGDALDGLLALVGRRMLALARGITRSYADAEDVLQESLLKIVRAVHAFRDGTNGYAWVMRIVRNTALDFLRKKRRIAIENLDEFFSLSDERYSAERREEALILEDALQKLGAEDRKMIYYRYYLDFTVREIAAETGMSKSSAERALQRAEERLKELLKE